MDIKRYKVIITPSAYEEMNQIYNYIVQNLYAEKSAKELMQKIEEVIQKLKYAPKIYAKIEKLDELKRVYRRVIVKKYVILYTIDEEDNTVFVTHIYYGKRNYIDNNLL